MMMVNLEVIDLFIVLKRTNGCKKRHLLCFCKKIF